MVEGIPELVSRGFTGAEDGASELMQAARQVVQRSLETSNAEEMTDWCVMKEKIRGDQALHRKTDVAKAADHAADSGGLNLREGVERPEGRTAAER